MKKRLYLMLVSMLMLSPAALADTTTAGRQTVFNDVTDYVATVGRDPQDKKEILKERRDIRREARLKSEARRKREETRKRMKEQQELILRKVRANSN